MCQRRSFLIEVNGIVQGVGMRPFIYKLAQSLNLCGYVKNKGASVVIVASAEQQVIEKFLYELKSNPPPNANIYDINILPYSDENLQDFKILDSSEDQQRRGFLLPDLAVCNDCLENIRNPQDRRYNYAFTNCTNCGPRYSILKDLPYDRENTSMKLFAMCPECGKEFKNPEERRFHAQPNCCPVCGPKYILRDSHGELVDCESPIKNAKELLKKGKILAIKGIGGYHLVCNAQDENAVANLRDRKKRPHKPLAIMVSRMEDVKGICIIGRKEEEAISNNKRPIVLLKKSSNCPLPEVIAPKLNQYGVMLPYTPLHYLLFDDTLKYLVMTSGNISGMAICYKDKDALEHLNQVADYFLLHNREIMTPIDDSVVRVFGDEVLISRCGRGYAPMALPLDTPYEILSLGGNQKASICFTHKKVAHISQYLGELNFLDTCNEYTAVVNRLAGLLKASPQVVVHDLHPNYFSTKYAKRLEKEVLIVQHHHAHMAGCMAEHGFTGDGIGVIFDGTGVGIDGNIWGGEFFVGSRSKFKRVAHLENVTLQGIDSAIEEPWKCALSYLYTINEKLDSYFSDVDHWQSMIIEKALENRVNCFQSSSMGRLFDCIAALTLQRSRISYEAQAAMELESVVDATITDEYCFSIFEGDDGTFIMGYQSILMGVLQDIKNQQPISVISTKFHNTICKATIACACKIRDKFDLNYIFLSGGVFENSYLLKNMVFGLEQWGFHVFFNKKTPLNDGGLSFGQASVAASILEGGDYVSGSSY
ncbi:carbamoyltransferase HypF [Anaerotignum sp. MB30-C6]|uniref:carbamoyltransferase HypF n=1 Tax=Anaerotignum sp. MB30-C6 TaxID=3070814 RepID=UPI0027DE28A8|nr:carbamoyltransferase HypF [Anaerotignum sp. MB30-C6]WMI79980.1 carbamoyltransferase HypF [Anaerotignum sp. MB30-C6]